MSSELWDSAKQSKLTDAERRKTTAEADKQSRMETEEGEMEKHRVGQMGKAATQKLHELKRRSDGTQIHTERATISR